MSAQSNQTPGWQAAARYLASLKRFLSEHGLCPHTIYSLSYRICHRDGQSPSRLYTEPGVAQHYTAKGRFGILRKYLALRVGRVVCVAIPAARVGWAGKDVVCNLSTGTAKAAVHAQKCCQQEYGHCSLILRERKQSAT
jgi:hypothetical protein